MKKLLIISALAAILVLSGCTQGAGEESVVKIGVITPLSGDAASVGEPISYVLDYALPKINEKNADKGVSFELIYEDGKCTGNDSAAAYQKLKDIDGVKFIIGGLCSSETLAIAPLTEADQILSLSPGSSSPEVEGASKFSYTLSYNDNVIADTIAKEMSKYKKVAIISEQNDFNTAMRDAWLSAIKQYDVEVVANEEFPKGGTDFRVTLEKIAQSKPDAVFINPNVGVTAQNLVKQIGENAAWKEFPLFSHYAYTGPEAINAAPEVTDGMIVVDSPEVNDEAFLAIKSEIEEQQGSLADLGNYYSASTLDAIEILTDLIVEFGADPVAVRDALVSRTFDAHIGEFQYGDSNFPGVEGGIYIIENGEAVYQN